MDKVPTYRLLGRFALWFLLAAWGSRTAAQSPTPDRRGAQGPVVLRTTTRLVQINVIVHDKKGKPVEGLKKEDFTILDQGKEEQVAVFSANSGSVSDRGALPDLPANVFSNRGGTAAANPGSVTVILFDALNTPIHEQLYAKQQILKFLSQIQPQDHVAIYVLTTKIIVLNDFTHDSRLLLKAIQEFSGSASPYQYVSGSGTNPPDQRNPPGPVPGADLVGSRLRKFFDAADDKINDFEDVNRAEATTSAIEAIANHVAQIPGRKSLIWVSSGFPIDIGFDAETLFEPGQEHRTFTVEVQRATRALNQANMAIYPVDARGLTADSHYGGANSNPFNPRLPTGNIGIALGNRYTMNLLADRTGGKAFYNTNDIEGSVRRAIGEGQFSYTLGFYPTHGQWDGKFHRLSVYVNEKGLRLRHREGYLALPDPLIGPQENMAALGAAINSPVEWTNLSLKITLKAFNPSARTLDLLVGLDGHELFLSSKEDRWIDSLHLIFGQLGKEDKIITSGEETLRLKLKPETYAGILQNEVKFNARLTVLRDVVSLRVIAQDNGSGAIGTLTVPIEKYLEMESARNQPAPENP